MKYAAVLMVGCSRSSPRSADRKLLQLERKVTLLTGTHEITRDKVLEAAILRHPGVLLSALIDSLLRLSNFVPADVVVIRQSMLVEMTLVPGILFDRKVISFHRVAL